MLRNIVIAVIILLSLSFGFSALANSINLSGYIYSENLGWISLGCINTNSCQDIEYGVINNDDGSLSGYGFSQNGEWVNFNPNYGGTKMSKDGFVSGWVFSEKSGWIIIDNEKNTSAEELKEEATSIKKIIDSENVSSIEIINLLHRICLKFLNSSECSIINY